MGSAKRKAELPILQFPDQAAWSEWLEGNHASSDGVRLKFAKKGAPITTVTFSQALEAALCYGWIDGTINRFDDHFYTHRFTPRRKGSKWSQINCRNAERLIAAGRMRSAGLAQVEAAKADGRWDAAYEPPSTATVPEDLQTALNANPKAKAFFETLTGANRYAVIYRVNDAKRPETRAKRIAQFVAMLAAGQTLH
jgi:uncharacterized protein YdeI (YjbR/CyaY-like superfamily)